ncbi:MAG: CsgG/HfaB family protein [Elusimicrobiota bacterium]|jgi:curli biogenesis system outer membrane secretion channel CsgG
MRTCTSILAAALVLVGCTTIKEYPFEQRRLAAVMPFAFTAAQKEFAPHASGLADGLAGALVRTGRLRLVERARVDAALQELQLQQSGITDSAAAAKVGKQLNAGAVVLGSVTSISVREEGRSVKIAEKTTRYVDVEVEARIVDVETGELLGSGRAIGKAESAEKHAFGGKVGQLASADALVQQALIGVCEDLARNMSKSLPPK